MEQEEWNYRNLLCTNLFDNNIVGGRFTDIFKYVTFEIESCVEGQGYTCRSPEEVRDFFLTHPVNIIYTNMYKDSSSDDIPIKYYITEPLEIYIDMTETVNIEFPL
jgi:hypothetical protein